MEIPPLNSEIVVEFVTGPCADPRPVSGILRVVIREPGRVCIELTAGPHDGRIVNITLPDDADESPGFAESDDAGEDWKKQP